MDSDLHKIYLELSHLFGDIKHTCSTCRDYDCEGYVWLLEEEAALLYDLNVPILEVNESSFFIHSFEEVNGVLCIDKPKPPCKLRQKGLCTIYDHRPLSCRMYPIGFEIVDAETLVALHSDCMFSRNLNGEAKKLFITKAIGIIKKMPMTLIDEIANTYRDVHAISNFPDGPNAFEVIAPLNSITKERR